MHSVYANSDPAFIVNVCYTNILKYKNSVTTYQVEEERKSIRFYK